MKNKAVFASIGLVLLLFAWTGRSLADDKPGEEPKEFRLAILYVDDVSFVLPSVILLDATARQNPLNLVVTNHTKKEHGFAIDSMKVSIVLRPGETKTIKVAVADMVPLARTQAEGYRTYDPLYPKDIGSLIYFRY
ncbi:MAG TPA: hypothetical protein VGJ57_01025 [Nitrospirales bacterium]|jgi:hypothetical protein